MNILLLGSGGREHAFAWKIVASPLCKKLYVAPGNAGTQQIAENAALNINDFDQVASFSLQHDINLIVVGPEEPLVRGIKDYFLSIPDLRHIPVIGPDKLGATLEGSKDFSKNFMLEHGIPTAKSATFVPSQITEAIAYVSQHSLPVVLKADGLAAGKGVLICQSHEEAAREIKSMLVDLKFGQASAKVVVEEFLQGIELSVFVVTDGKSYKILPEAKDYKRIGDGDTGLNTGGMGAVSPVVFATTDFLQKVEDRIIQPTIKGLRKAGMNYSGFIFIGLMNVNGDPYVIEYNVRMGDPETEVVLPRIKSDFVAMLQAVAHETLDQYALEIDEEAAATVVMVAGGYPENYDKGDVISGLEHINKALVFHAGTKRHENGHLLTNGGRVLTVTGKGKSIAEALEYAYAGVEKIQWKNVNYRKDIGKDLLSFNFNQ